MAVIKVCNVVQLWTQSLPTVVAIDQSLTGLGQMKPELVDDTNLGPWNEHAINLETAHGYP